MSIDDCSPGALDYTYYFSCIVGELPVIVVGLKIVVEDRELMLPVRGDHLLLAHVQPL